MKHLFFCGFFCVLLNTLYSDEHAIKFVTPNTLVQYGPQTIPSISEIAMVSLFGTTVDGSVHVDGTLTASEAQMGSVVVNGNASFTNCIIKGALSVYGNLQMQNCQVFGQISTYAPFLSLDKTQAPSIINLSKQGQQTIALQNQTFIKGTITFASGNGLVNLYGGSYVVGSVAGGRIK